jgi:hypothetical protein
MPEYKIEFQVDSSEIYYTYVEAESPQEGLRLWKEDPNQYDAEPDYTIECTDLIETVECIGEWIPDEKDNRFSSLKRYEEPIKLNED